MIKKMDCVTWKVLVSVLFVLVLSLQACSPLSEMDMGETAGVSATWTPAVHPTDQPYEVDTTYMSYLGGDPVLVILGSLDPTDTSPLKVENISTDDVYDVSSISPASASTWSRPIVAENKDVYFQVGGTLYILSPGGQTRSIELPYNEEDPAYCNWSWKGQLVCLNEVMTTGFLVDQELNVVELKLPADNGSGSGVYFEPYRVGENGMRTIRTMTKTVNGKETVSYMDLDLETLTIQSHQIRIEQNFNRTFIGSDGVEYTQEGGNLNVIGITDDGEKIYLCSSVTDLSAHLSIPKFWVEIYDVTTQELFYNEVVINPDVEMKFYQNYLITGLVLDENNTAYELPVIIDLDSGKIFEEFSGHYHYYYLTYAINYSILPYEEGWIFRFPYSLEYHRKNGDLMETYYFTDYMIEFIGPDSYYTVTQPMEP